MLNISNFQSLLGKCITDVITTSGSIIIETIDENEKVECFTIYAISLGQNSPAYPQLVLEASDFVEKKNLERKNLLKAG